MTLADLCDVVYALQVDYYQRMEIALIAAGGEMQPGELVEKFDDWLECTPEVVDPEKAQLLAALGVAP